MVLISMSDDCLNIKEGGFEKKSLCPSNLSKVIEGNSKTILTFRSDI